MKKLVKLLALALCAIMAFSMLAACGSGEKADDTAADTAEAVSVKDLDAVKAAGKLVVGMTDYAPMNFKDENGEWTGFDTEFAEAFAQILGVDVEFVEIDWDNKWFELKSGNVDCIWNGMTITDEGKTNADISVPYAKNNQVLITANENVDKVEAEYDENDELTAVTIDGKVAVESGSAGQTAAEDFELEVVECQLQTDALLEVKSGKSVGCVIDATMAGAMLKEDSDYADLTVALTLTDEEYGVAFRQGSDLTSEFNKAFDAFIADGTLKALSEKYNVELTK